MCFSLAWFENLLIWLVIVVAVIAIIKIFLPFVLPYLGTAGAIVLRIVEIVIWAVVAIFVITFAFEMISCLIGMGGGLHLPGSSVR
jgi:hypothetical protein